MVDILFSEGLDESVDPRLAGPTKLIVARNVIQKQSGLFEARPGTENLSTLYTGYYDGTAINGDIGSDDAIQMVVSGTVGNYFMDNTRLYCFSSTTGKMSVVDQIPEASADMERLFESDNDITHGMDVSVYTTTNLKIVAFSPAATTPSVYVSVYDSSGVPVLGDIKVSAAGVNSRGPRVLVCGSTAVVLWTDVTNGNLKASKLDLTNIPGGWSAAATVVAIAGYNWDAAVKSSTTFSLVYEASAGGLNCSVCTVSSLALSTVSFAPPAAGTCIAMAVNVDAGTRVCALYALENAGTVTAYRQTFTTASPPVAADGERNTGMSLVTGGGLNVQLSCINYTGSSTDWFAMSGTLTSGTDWSTQLVGITSAGSVGTVRTVKDHYLGSRLIRQTAVGSGTMLHAMLVATRFFSAPGTSVGYYDGSYLLVNFEIARTSSEPYFRMVARVSPRVLQPALLNQRKVPNLILESTASSGAHNYVTVGSSRFGASLSTVRGGVTLFRFAFGDPMAHPTVELRPGEWLIGGGIPSTLDGRLVTEVSFESGTKFISAVVGSLSGSLANGNYRYAAHWEWRSKLGSVDYSAPAYSTVTAVTSGPFANINTTWKGLPFSVKDDFDSGAISAVRLVLARTLNLDNEPNSPYFRLYSDNYPSGTAVPHDGTNISYVDTASDTLLAMNPLLYTTAVVENQAPPASRHVCLHKGRAVLLGADNTLYFSRYLTEGEAVAFNDSLTYPITSGKAFAVASNGELLVFFQKQKLFGISGEGPNDGGNGYDYSAPKELSSVVGTDNWRSVVETELGVFFASQSKGIFLLTKNQQVRWIGDRVQKTFEAYPVVTAAKVHPTLKLVMFACTTTAYGAGVVLVYDMAHDIWTTFDYNVSGDGNDNIRTMGVVGDSVYLTAAGSLQKETGNWFSDGTSSANTQLQAWATHRVRTGWLAGEPNGHIILRRVRYHGELVSNHGLSVDFYRDFGANIDGNSHNVNSATVAALSLERLSFGPQYMRGQAFSISISDTEVATGGAPPASYGAGFKLHSLTCDVIPIRGPFPRIAPTAQK